MHKNHTGIQTTWSQKLNEAHYCDVFIWDNEISMMSAFSATKYLRRNDAYLGRCIGSIWVKCDKKYIAPPKFEEIHLAITEIGAGYVAHEIQHLVNYWSIFNRWTRSKHDEKIAYFCSDFTTEFWNKFYERYKTWQT